MLRKDPSFPFNSSKEKEGCYRGGGKKVMQIAGCSACFMSSVRFVVFSHRNLDVADVVVVFIPDLAAQ